MVLSRLINVRKDQPCIIKAEEVKFEHSEDMRYATLSYCWGDMAESCHRYVLQMRHLGDSKRNFCIHSLSAVQKDAVMVSGLLGIPYPWIDALCMRQDDTLDWKRKSSMMHGIYCNYFLTNLQPQNEVLTAKLSLKSATGSYHI